MPQQAGLWATSPVNPGAAGCFPLAKLCFTASSDLRRSAVGSVLNSLRRICLPHPFSAVREKDSTQTGAQSKGRALAEELSASALARGSLGAAGRGCWCSGQAARLFYFPWVFRKDEGDNLTAFPDVFERTFMPGPHRTGSTASEHAAALAFFTASLTPSSAAGSVSALEEVGLCGEILHPRPTAGWHPLSSVSFPLLAQQLNQISLLFLIPVKSPCTSLNLSKSLQLYSV